MDAGDTHTREHLLRYCARAPLNLQRLAVLEDGRISYQHPHAYKGSAAVRIMTPLQFMGRLAALVPPPRHPLMRFYGVFAPDSKWRSAVVPQREAAPHAQCAHGSSTEKSSANADADPNAPTPPKQAHLDVHSHVAAPEAVFIKGPTDERAQTVFLARQDTAGVLSGDYDGHTQGLSQ